MIDINTWCADDYCLLIFCLSNHLIVAFEFIISKNKNIYLIDINFSISNFLMAKFNMKM